MPALKTQLIRVGHSPDPDDAFMFYALAKEKIPMQGFRVEHVIEDIETLNQRALHGELEVTAVSCHAYAYLADRYLVMNSGASVGDNYGPILVSKTSRERSIRGKKIAVPGKLTTAYLVLQLLEKDFEPVFTPFDEILESVRSGKTDLGLVIHEGQITFKEAGLHKVMDLGGWWYERTRLPLPLGVDIIRRDLGAETIRSFSQLFKASIQYALDHRADALAYALQYGRGIGCDLGDPFVGMYVNDLTIDLGEKGKAGFRRLLAEAHKAGLLPQSVELEFV